MRSLHALVEAAADHLDSDLPEDALPFALQADRNFLPRVPESDDFQLSLTE